jgi:hypothetical protein
MSKCEKCGAEVYPSGGYRADDAWVNTPNGGGYSASGVFVNNYECKCGNKWSAFA